MKVLLDTHVFLWWITNDLPRLSDRAQEIFRDGGNTLFLSAASVWEISIKAQLGKITLPDKPSKFFTNQLAKNAILALPIHVSHAIHVYSLPIYHQDPFDRMLIAQSQLEKLPIMTVDQQISRYDVEILW